MRITTVVLAAIAVAGSVPAYAATLEVGAGKKYTTIAAATYAAKAYDTIIVYPGTYAGAQIKASNVTIKAASGTTPSQVVVKGSVVGGKGLFLVSGSNVTVQGLRFEGAKNSSNNGAGIRLEGTGLNIVNSQFVNNQDGVLATTLAGKVGTIKISGSRFEGNGAGDGQSHGIYVSKAGKLEITGSYFVNTKVGHHIKSRAPNTVITNSTITDGTTGTASFLIDLPDGGAATISGNTLIKGPNSSNAGTAIAFGFEQYVSPDRVNPAGPVLISNNKFTNLDTTRTYFVRNKSLKQSVTLSGNTLSGPVTALYGAGTVSLAIAKLTSLDADFASLSTADQEMLAGLYIEAGGLSGEFTGNIDVEAGASGGTASVPEPAAVALFGLGAGMLLFGRRKLARARVACA